MKIKSNTVLLIGALSAGALMTGVAIGGDGQELKPEQQELFSMLDINRDGVITQEEAQHYPELAETFDQLDERGDGQLDKAEFARFEVPEEEDFR